MPVIWDDTAHKKLLLTIINLLAPTTLPKWEVVAAAMGEGYTVDSIRKQYAKLKKSLEDTEGGADAAATPKKTPAKRGKKAKDEGGESTAKKRKAKQDVEEDDVEESPSKKVKAEGAGDAEDDEV